jgi:hypothetical protein
MILLDDEMIGKSLKNCIIIEEEVYNKADGRSNHYIATNSRKIKLLFNAMDNLGIRRIHPESFTTILSTMYNDDAEEERLEHSNSAQIEDFEYLLEEKMDKHPEYFEMGLPETEIHCHKECRGKAEITIENCNGSSVVIIKHPDTCLYRKCL